MTARSRQVALALTVVLAADAACRARDHHPPESGHLGASAVRDRGFTLVASGGVLPHDSVIDRARFDAGGAGHDFRPMFSGVRSVVAGADLALCHTETVHGADGDRSGHPVGKSPPVPARSLTGTGYDGCSTAFDVDAGRVVSLDRALEEGAEVCSVRDRIRAVVLSRGAAKGGLVMGEQTVPAEVAISSRPRCRTASASVRGPARRSVRRRP